MINDKNTLTAQSGQIEKTGTRATESEQLSFELRAYARRLVSAEFRRLALCKDVVELAEIKSNLGGLIDKSTDRLWQMLGLDDLGDGTPSQALIAESAEELLSAINED